MYPKHLVCGTQQGRRHPSCPRRAPGPEGETLAFKQMITVAGLLLGAVLLRKAQVAMKTWNRWPAVSPGVTETAPLNGLVCPSEGGGREGAGTARGGQCRKKACPAGAENHLPFRFFPGPFLPQVTSPRNPGVAPAEQGKGQGGSLNLPLPSRFGRWIRRRDFFPRLAALPLARGLLFGLTNLTHFLSSRDLDSLGSSWLL